MKIGVSLVGFGLRSISTVAQRADALGYESVWMAEHLVMPARLPDSYPYTIDGRPPMEPGTPLFDPWVALSFVAASTSKVKLGTAIYILPLRNPLVTARAVTTLDRLSGGRVILGAGIGWLREEFAAAGEEFDHRGDRAAEIVEILRRLWTEETIEHRGRHYSFDAIRFEPKPSQKPHPPIVFGGETPAALRRAATLADGWIGTSLRDPDAVRAIVDRLTGLRAEAGRGAEPFEVTIDSPFAPTVELLRRYEDAGVHRVILRPGAKPTSRVSVDEALVELERTAESVLGKL